MSTNYSPSNQIGNRSSNTITALIMTLAVFAIVPLLHIFQQLHTNKIPVAPFAPTKYLPDVVEKQPKKIEDEKKVKKPKLEEERTYLTLNQIPHLLNPRSGGVTAHLNYAGFTQDDAAKAWEEIYDSADLDQRPKPIFIATPNYPYALKGTRIEGWVILEWIITANGRNKQIRVTQSSHREFEESAKSTIAKSRYSPGEKNGKKVNTRVKMRIDFKS